jgi:hypothetical protein
MNTVRKDPGNGGQRTGVSVSVNGYVEVRYDLGSGPTSLTSVGPIQLGEWHHLLVERYRQVSSAIAACRAALAMNKQGLTWFFMLLVANDFILH